MWTIIQRKEDKVFDLIPNCWLLNSSTCHYPNFGLKTTKTFARKCQEPDDSWEVLEMEIVDKDIDNYERGMTNVIRFSKGKKSVTSSEEERNHNKRKKTKNSFFEYDVSHPIGLPALSPASSSNDEDETTNSVKYTKITPTSNVTPPALEPPAKKCVSSTPKKVCKLQNRKHYCVFESTKGVTFESIGHALCVITRKLEMQTSNNSVIKDDIRELRTSLENVRGAAEIQPRGCEEETMLVMNEFPLKNVDEVEALEEKLKAKDFLQACVVYLSSVAEITSESRTVTSIMSRILTLETAMCYTWKGVCRKDHKFQKKPFNKLTLSYVVLAAVKRCWPECDKGKVETSASVWIAQAKAKADRLSAKKVVAEDAEDAHL